MNWTMAEVSEMYSISEHTLRYYDNIKLIPGVIRDDRGVRLFTDDAVGWMRYIISFRSTGMPIKDVRKYIELTETGNDTLPTRIEMLKNQAEKVDQQIAQLQSQREIILDKLHKYQSGEWKD